MSSSKGIEINLENLKKDEENVSSQKKECNQKQGDKCCNNDSNCQNSSGTGTDGKKKIKPHKPTKKKIQYTIVFFVVSVPIMACIMEIFWLLDIVENEFELWFCYVSMAFLFFMALISYYRSVTIKNHAVLRNVPVVESTVVDPIARELQSCPTCNDKWKPPRSHHCSTCGGCMIGMDHHCPWIINCVGLRNHRAFWLFTVYMTLGGLHYCYRSWNYFYFLYETQEFFSRHPYYMYGMWSFASLFLYPGTILLIGLTFFHTGMIISGSTTLDIMSGTKMTCPCVPENPESRSINPYDRGVIANVYNFFQGDLFWWWWPSETISEHDGTQIPRSPFCNLQDIQKVVRSNQPLSRVIEDKIDVHQMTINLDQKIDQEKHQYKDFNFVIQGKIYEYWKIYEEKYSNEVPLNDAPKNIQDEVIHTYLKSGDDQLEHVDQDEEQRKLKIQEQQLKLQKEQQKIDEEQKLNILFGSQEAQENQESQQESLLTAGEDGVMLVDEQMIDQLKKL